MLQSNRIRSAGAGDLHGDQSALNCFFQNKSLSYSFVGLTTVATTAATIVAILVTAEPRIRGLAINSLVLSIAVAAIALPVGAVLAFLLARTDLPARRWLLVAVLSLLFIPLYLQAAAWQAGFGVQGAFVPYFGGIPWVQGWFGTIWVHAITSIPWVVLIIATALLGVDRRLEEHALLDFSPLRVFWRVTLPHCAGACAVSALFVAVGTAGEMTVTNLFQVRTLTEELYTQLSLGESTDSPKLIGGSAWLFACVVILIGLVLGTGLMSTVLRPPRTARPFQLHHWRRPAMLVIALLLMIVLGLPLVSLGVKCGLAVRATPDGGRVRTWSLAKCLSLVAASPVRFQREFAWSLTLATLSASVTTVAAAVLAWQARCRVVGRWIAVLVIALGLSVPGPLIGLTLIAILDRPNASISNWLYDQTVFAPVVALTIRALPIAALILWYALARLPIRLLELAEIEGANLYQRLRWIVLPSAGPALVAAWLAAFCIALGDVSATILVLPPGVDTIALRLFERLHFGAEDQVAGISLVLVGVFAGSGATMLWLLQRGDPTGTPLPGRE